MQGRDAPQRRRERILSDRCTRRAVHRLKEGLSMVRRPMASRPKMPDGVVHPAFAHGIGI
jgi:hypothetical protein